MDVIKVTVEEINTNFNKYDLFTKCLNFKALFLISNLFSFFFDSTKWNDDSILDSWITNKSSNLKCATQLTLDFPNYYLQFEVPIDYLNQSQ